MENLKRKVEVGDLVKHDIIGEAILTAINDRFGVGSIKPTPNYQKWRKSEENKYYEANRIVPLEQLTKI